MIFFLFLQLRHGINDDYEYTETILRGLDKDKIESFKKEIEQRNLKK